MNIVVLSRNPSLYSTQSIVNAARARNHYVRVIDHMYCDMIIDNRGLEIHYNNQKLENIHAVIPRIGTSATNYGAAVIRQFESMGIFTTLGSEPLLKSRDKLSCLQILAAHGIKVPRSGIGNNYYTQSALLDLVGRNPHVLKLINGTHGLGVILSQQKSNAESILEAFHRSDQMLMIQQFIKESAGMDIRAFIVDGVIVGAMKRVAAAGDFRSNLHRGAIGEKIVLSEIESTIARRAAEIMGLKIAGVDMLISNSGPMVLEVNASPGLEGIEGVTKIDIASKIIEFVENNVMGIHNE